MNMNPSTERKPEKTVAGSTMMMMEEDDNKDSQIKIISSLRSRVAIVEVTMKELLNE